MPASADSRIGTELAGYRLEALLGRGGMGVVYRAHDLALDRDVALKLLAPHLAGDVSFRERFLTESRVAASLEHPNVVPIHDAGEIDGQLYIAMRLVEGSDLKAVLRDGPLEPARAVRVLEQIAGALDAAHARGLVHRDVKPSNVLLDEREHVYLADFGLSRYLDDAALPLGPAKSLGTADYVAPEQIRGEEVDGRADVYALGCMLYECLAGEPPFRRGTDAATLYAQLEEAPPVLPGLEEVLPKALAKEPAQRYGSLQRADRGRQAGARDRRAEAQPLAAHRRRRRHRADRGSPCRLLPHPRRRRRGRRARRRHTRPHRPEDEQGHAHDAGRTAGRSVAADGALRLGNEHGRRHRLADRREDGERAQTGGARHADGACSRRWEGDPGRCPGAQDRLARRGDRDGWLCHRARRPCDSPSLSPRVRTACGSPTR